MYNLYEDTDFLKEEIEAELCEQAFNYKEDDIIQFDDIMGPSFGSDLNTNSIEVCNRGGLRHVSIEFTGETFKTTQNEYSSIKKALDEFIKGESDESVDNAIDEITRYGDKAIKVVFSFARKFDFNNDTQYNDLKILMNKLCLRSLEGRDTIIAVLIGANSKPHIKLAMLAAGEVREENATKYICEKLRDKDLFDIAFDALIDIRNPEAIKPMLEIISETEKDDEWKITYLRKRAPYFIDFGNDVIKEGLQYYNNCNPWLKAIYSLILAEFKEDIIPELSNVVDNETDNRKLEKLFMLLGKLDNDKAADILINSYNSSKNMKACIIGLGQMKSTNAKKLVKDVLKEGREDTSILEESVVALSFMVNKNEVEEAIELIKSYKDSISDRLRIHANFALARLDDKESLERYINNLTDSDVYLRNCAGHLINRLKLHQITKILEMCLTIPENKVNLILTSMTKRKNFNKESGNILFKLLEKSSYLSKIEIYKIIGNTAGTKNEVLPVDILYNALDNTNNQSEKIVLEDILSKIKRVGGGLGK